MRFVKKRCKELECLDAKMRRSKVCYREKSSIQWGEGNRTSVVEMNQNSFIDKVYSLFTTYHSFIFTNMVFSLFTKNFNNNFSMFRLFFPPFLLSRILVNKFHILYHIALFFSKIVQDLHFCLQ